MGRGLILDLVIFMECHLYIGGGFELGLSVGEVALISGHRNPRMLFSYTHFRAEEVGKKLRHETANRNLIYTQHPFYFLRAHS